MTTETKDLEKYASEVRELTTREKEILNAVLAGMRIQEIVSNNEPNSQTPNKGDVAI